VSRSAQSARIDAIDAATRLEMPTATLYRKLKAAWTIFGPLILLVSDFLASCTPSRAPCPLRGRRSDLTRTSNAEDTPRLNEVAHPRDGSEGPTIRAYLARHARQVAHDAHGGCPFPCSVMTRVPRRPCTRKTGPSAAPKCAPVWLHADALRSLLGERRHRPPSAAREETGVCSRDLLCAETCAGPD